MSEWKTVRLGDVFDLQMGKTPERKNLDFFSTTDNKWISIADISKADKYIFETKEYISDEAVKKSGIKQIPANTVIMSFKLSIGKTAITKEPMYSNEAIMAFLPNGKYEVDNDFLYHLFSNKDWSEGSNKAVKGITLNKASLLEVKILLPPLTIQKQIAKTMDKCTEIISKNKRMLENYDTLIKSRFIEMFGDPVLNPMGWEEVRITELCKNPDDIKCGPFGTQLSKDEYQKKGVPIFGIPQINSSFRVLPTDFLTNSKAEKLDAYSLIYGDIAMSRKGNVGKCAIYSGKEKGIIHSDVVRLRVDDAICNSIYLMNQLHINQKVETQISNVSSGAIMAGINVTKMKDIIVYNPPLSLQNDFATFVQQIDKSKFEYTYTGVAA